jgi:uncharacterized C2H2 Zn-finger protein
MRVELHLPDNTIRVTKRNSIIVPGSRVIVSAEVILTRDGTLYVSCPRCRKLGDLEKEFGWRNMGDGVIRNQPQCRSCR